jgi:hypothetical protein
LGALFGVIGIIVGLTLLLGERTVPASSTDDYPALACFAAQNTVKQRLKDPSSAVFQSCLEPTFVRPQGADEWLVTSFVQTHDGSGILRPHAYQVSVTRGGGLWRAVILSLQ